MEELRGLRQNSIFVAFIAFSYSSPKDGWAKLLHLDSCTGLSCETPLEGKLMVFERWLLKLLRSLPFNILSVCRLLRFCMLKLEEK